MTQAPPSLYPIGPPDLPAVAGLPRLPSLPRLPVFDPGLPPQIFDTDIPRRRHYFDTLAHARRLTTPTNVHEKRRVRRMTIEEINESDIDSLVEKMEVTGRTDTRSGFERFLDLLDAPRNLIAAYAFSPSLRRQAEESGEIGAMGVGRVTGADILRDMGVESRILRGLLGFAIDIATDPLTYLGPVGWVAKVAKGGGAILRSGVRAIRGGVSAAARGERVADDAVRAFIESAGYTPERVARLKQRLVAGGRHTPEEAEAILRDRMSSLMLGRLRQTGGKVGGVMGWDAVSQSSRMAELAEMAPAAAAAIGPRTEAMSEAAREFFRRYGRAAAPGVRIGRRISTGKPGVEVAGQGLGDIPAGSALFHIPFTSYGVFVPPFTTGSAANVGFALASSAARAARDAGETVAAAAGPFEAASKRLEDLANEAKRIIDQGGLEGAVTDPMRRLEEIRDEAREISVSISAGMQPGRMPVQQPLRSISDVVHEADNFRRARSLVEYLDTMRRADADELERLRRGLEGSADPVDEFVRMVADESQLSMREMVQEVLAARVKAAQALADAIHAPLVATLSSADANVVRVATRALGLDPDVVGPYGFGPLKQVAESLFRSDTTTAAAIHDLIDRAGGVVRRHIGPRTGRLNRIARELIRASTPMQNRAYTATAARITSAIRSAGLGPEQVEAGSQLVGLMMLRRIDPNMEMHPNSPAWGLLREAMSGGLLDETIHPGMAARLQSIADSEVARLRAMGGPMDRYLPHVLSDEARAALIGNLRAFTRQIRGRRGVVDSERTMLGIVESFEKPRSTLVYNTPDGPIYEWERAILNALEPEDIVALPQPVRSRLTTVMQLLVAHGKDIDQGLIPGRYLDPWEVNDLVRQGAFSILTGSADLTQSGFFVTDAVRMMAGRSAQQYRAALRDQLQVLVRQHGLRVNENEIARVHNTPGLTHVVTAGGVRARIQHIRRNGMNVPVLVIGGQRYRQILPRHGLSSEFDPAVSLFTTDVYQAWLPERVADMLEYVSEPFLTPDSTHGLLRLYDAITKAWRGITLFHPSWVMANMVGNLHQAVWAVRDPALLARHAPDAMRIVSAYARGDDHALRNITLTLAGRRMTGHDLVSSIASAPIFQASSYAEAFMHLLGDGTYRLGPVHSMWTRRGWRQMRENAARAVNNSVTASMLMQTPAGRAVGLAKGIVVDELAKKRVLRPFFLMNERAEQFVRATALLSLLDQGYSLEAASARLAETMFDFTDMTRTETAYLRRIIPFYSWLRNSSMYTLRMLLEDPRYASMVPKLREALEEATAGEEAIPIHLRPTWMRDMLAAQVGTDPERASAILLATLFPQEQGLRMAAMAASPLIGPEGLREIFKLAGTSLNPQINAAVGLGMGRDPFTDRKIGFSQYEGDIAWHEYLASQIRILRETGLGTGRTSPIITAAERGPEHIAGRVLLGGRFIPFTREYVSYHRARELRELKESIMKAIRLAERDGRREESVAARARLMRLYQDMLDAGLDEEVPRWARKQLAAMRRR